MKISGFFLVCLLLPTFSFSKFLDIFPSSTTCPDAEVNAATTDIIKICQNSVSEKIESISENLQIVNEIFELHYENLIFIIADNTKDAMKLGEFLTHDEKLLPKKKREEFEDEKKSMYDFILENLHLYKHPNESTVFLAFPRKANFNSYTSQLIFEVMKPAFRTKFLLTLPAPVFHLDLASIQRQKEQQIFKLFEMAAKMLKNVKGFGISSLLVITNGQFSKKVIDSEETEKNDDYLETIVRYTKSVKASNNGKLLAQSMIERKNIIILDQFRASEYDQLATHLNRIPYTALNIFDYQNQLHILIDCWYNLLNLGLIHSMNSLPMALDSELAKVKNTATTLSGFFKSHDKVNRIYESLSTFRECMKANSMTVFSLCFANLKQDLMHFQNPSINNFTVKANNNIAMLCTVHWWSQIIHTSDVEYISESGRWTMELEKYRKMLWKVKNWYQWLRMVYDQVDLSSKEETASSLNDLQKELERDTEKDRHRDMMRDAFNVVKSNAVKMRATVSCIPSRDGGKLQIIGEFLKLSLIINRTFCIEGYRILEIFALNKVLIDEDIQAVGQELMVSIFSPVWEVVLERSINLDGISRNSTVQDYLEPGAGKGNNLNGNGAHGKAGLPGGPAGTFHGLAQTIINAGDLKISLNGGNGSNGQDGGDGADGEDGVIPSKKYVDSSLRKHSCRWYDYAPLNLKTGASNESVNYDSLVGTPLGLKYRKECYIFGLRGFPGGNGGNGGLKGKGGMSGEFKLFSLNGSSEFPVVLSAANGTDGRHGLGGKAGKGGVTRKLTIENFDANRFGIVRNETIDRAIDGEHGRDGVSTLGSEIPKGRSVLQSFALSANSYKRFVLSQITSHESKYVGLYKQMLANKQITKTYDTLTLVIELVDLEKEYHLMTNKSHAIFLYQSWKEGILDYFLHRKDTEKTNEYHNVLRYLDNMVSEKIRRIKETKDREIFLLSEYLVEFQKQLKNLKNAGKALQIKVAMAGFQDDDDQKIDKTQRIIQENVQREIDENNLKFTGEMEMILRHMASIVEKSEKLGDVLDENSRSLREKLAGKTLNDIFAILNICLGLINPSLEIIGVKFSEASSQIRNLIDDSADRNVVDVAIPKTTEDLRRYFDTRYVLWKQKQISVVEMILNLLKEMVKQSFRNGEDAKPLEDLAGFLMNFRNTLPEGDIVKALADKLEDQETLWRKEKKYSGSIKAIYQLKTYIRIKQMVDDLFPRLELNNTNILDPLSLEIDKAFGSIGRLCNFQDEVYTKLAPLIEKMRESPEFFSAVTFLDLKNFEVRKHFKEISKNLEDFILEFRVIPSFLKMIHELRDATDMVSDTFDRIHRQIEELKRIPYVRDLHLPPFDITYVKDAKLSLALTRFIQLSYANFVLDDYHKWMANFKQYIFPFAKVFTDVFGAPNRGAGDLVAEAEEAGTRLVSYGLQLNRKRVELSELGKITSAKFGYDLPPFHVWGSGQYSREINRILSGERVTLFANISEHEDINAVKFGDLWLRFRSSDPEIKEDDLNRDLQSFSVKLLHNGDSHYRCDEQVFVISSKSHNLEMMYYDGRGQMAPENLGNDANSMEKCILSPYATWTIELVSRDEDKSNEALKKYESKLDIELVGLGQFSGRDIDECDNLSEYQDFRT